MSPEKLAQLRREDARRLARKFLAERPGTAHPPERVAKRVNTEAGEDFTVEEIEAALNFLLDLGQICPVQASLGASTEWRITAAGTLAHERGQ